MKNRLCVVSLFTVLFLLAPAAVPAAPPPNDSFAAAALVSVYAATNALSLADATSEPGEPPHLAAPFRSAWWLWTAPVRGDAAVTNLLPAGGKVTLAVYTGNLLSDLSLLAVGNDVVRFPVTGGFSYYVAAAVPAETAGNIELLFSLEPRTVASPVPGNLLCEPSFENTGLRLTCWLGTNFGGGVNDYGGADGGLKSTWVDLSFRTLLFGIGSGLTNMPSLLNKITNQLDPLSECIWTNMSAQSQERLLGPMPITSKRLTLGPAFDSLLTNGPIYDPVLFADVAFSGDTLAQLALEPQARNILLLNRRLIEDAFAGDIGRAYAGTLAQDFPTVPGRTYEICFAVGHGNVPGSLAPVPLRVAWDNTNLAILQLPNSQTGWHWRSLTAVASGAITRLTLENVSTNNRISIDGVSVVWMNEAPTIVVSPAPVSTVAGGTASFLSGATGMPPLAFQWYFNGAPLAGKTNSLLQLDGVSASQAGSYFVTVTNLFGAAASAPASLTVEVPASLTIVLQPSGDHVAAGGYFSLNVAALGTPPLGYQWFRDNLPLANATNRQLVFAPVQPADAGTYQVKVSNSSGAAWSLPAALTVETSSQGGGAIRFANQWLQGIATNTVPIFDVDGTTRLSGPDYVAQLYAGASIERLRPVGAPSAFFTGPWAGLFEVQTVLLPTVPANTNVLLQVRAWQASKGVSYEEARALGGKFGRSVVFQGVTQAPPLSPLLGLPGLESFALQTGLPEFTVGRIYLVTREGSAGPVWSLTGAPGCRYVIEKAASGLVWRPALVLTNGAGTVTFSDPAPSPDQNVFYRARILD